MSKTNSIQDRISRTVRHFTRDIWEGDVPREDKGRRRLVILSRLAYMVGAGFFSDKCLLRATALAYTTILSIAPLLAVAFSISKGLGLQNTAVIRNILLKVSAGREELVENILSYVNQTSVGTLGSVGTIFLFVTVIALLSTVEDSFNAIWGVKQGRTLWRKLTDYFFVIFISPLFVFLAISFTVSMQNDALIQSILQISAFNYLYIALLKIAPYIMIWLAFFFLYAFIPNIRVRLMAALGGGIIAGTLWQVAQWTYISNQIGVARYNAIYGSFAQFPLFLIWMYISWIIVLLGAEITYALQHMKSFEGEIRAGHASQEDRNKLAVLILLMLTKSYETGRGGMAEVDLVLRLNVPMKLVHQILETLQEDGVVMKVDDDNEENRFILSRPPEKIEILDISALIARDRGGHSVLVIPEMFSFINDTFHRIYADARRSSGNTDLYTYYKRLCEDDLDHCLEGGEPSAHSA